MSEIDTSKLPQGGKGFAHDFAADQTTFKGVPWGKAMMWIFLLSDTFIFSCFLISLMTARASTTAEWPYPSEVFGLTMFGDRGSPVAYSNYDFCINYKQWNNGA